MSLDLYNLWPSSQEYHSYSNYNNYLSKLLVEVVVPEVQLEVVSDIWVEASSHQSILSYD